MSRPGDPRAKVFAFLGLCLLLHMVTSGLVMTTADYPTSNDEYEHLSYVFRVDREHFIFPNHVEQHVVVPETPGVASPDRARTTHPSFFYWLMTPFADTEQSAAENATRFRIINYLLSVCVVGLLLFASTQLLKSQIAQVAFGLIVVAYPYLTIVSGTFNNDVMALLGGALALLGAIRFTKGMIGTSPGVLMGAGLAIAGLSKLPAAITVGFFILFAHILMRDFWIRRPAGWRLHIFTVLLGGLIGATPYLATIILYGYLFPTGDPFFLQFGLMYETVDVLSYLFHYVTAIGVTWGMYGPSIPSTLAELAALAFATLALFGTVRSTRMQNLEPVQVIGLAGLLAFFMTIVVNIGFGYYSHLVTGVLAAMGGAKYFMPIWPMVALAAVYGATNMASRRANQIAPLILVGLILTAHLHPFVAGVFTPQSAPAFSSYLPDLKLRKTP